MKKKKETKTTYTSKALYKLNFVILEKIGEGSY